MIVFCGSKRDDDTTSDNGDLEGNPLTTEPEMFRPKLYLSCVRRPDGMYYVTSPTYPLLHIVDPSADKALDVAREVVRQYRENEPAE